MKKIIIETQNRLGYLDPHSGQVISSRRPTVVKSTPFVQEHIANSKFIMLASELPAEATDADFEEHYKECKGDKELAVASYVSKFTEGAETPPAPITPGTLKLNKK